MKVYTLVLLEGDHVVDFFQGIGVQGLLDALNQRRDGSATDKLTFLMRLVCDTTIEEGTHQFDPNERFGGTTVQTEARKAGVDFTFIPVLLMKEL